MLLVQFWRAKDVVCDKHAFIVLKWPIVANLLEPNTHMSQFAVNAPPRAIVHRYKVILTCPKLSKDNHSGPRAINCGSLVHDL
jgi:hypothetical protein